MLRSRCLPGVPWIRALNEVIHWIALRDTPGLSRRHVLALLECYGAPTAVFGRPFRELAERCGAKPARYLSSGPPLAAASAELERCASLGIEVLAPGSEDFPALLGVIPDPPLVLYARGDLLRSPRREEGGGRGSCLAIVGSRRPTANGRELAAGWAARIAARGVTIVSGLAYGIDAAAHHGALRGGGRTLAVLAGGLDRATPIGNAKLAARILEAGGGWLSEHPPGIPALAHHFPERNRLISGLALHSLIVEARERSGSLWTARHAIEQGREVLVVPGPVGIAQCRGSNALIRDGAQPVLDAEEVLASVLPGGVAARASSADPMSGLPPEAARILARLDEGPADVDALARELAIPPERLAPILLDLELDGHLGRSGARVARRG